MEQNKYPMLTNKLEPPKIVSAESLINMFNNNFFELKTILEMAKTKSKDNKCQQ